VLFALYNIYRDFLVYLLYFVLLYVFADPNCVEIKIYY